MGTAERAVPTRACALGGRWAELGVLSSSVTEIHGFTTLLKHRVKLNMDLEFLVDKMVHEPQGSSSRVTEESQMQRKEKGVCGTVYRNVKALCLISV